MAWLLFAPLLLACSGTESGNDCAGTHGPERPESVSSMGEAITQCSSQIVEGVDVFDGQGVIDWSALAAGGTAFALIKATQGTYDTQSRFAANWTQARRLGVRRGAYHFFDPTEDGTSQAQHFLSTVGPLADGDLPPMLDIECPDGDANCLGTGASGNAPASEITARMWAWMQTVERATRMKPVVYTFSSYFASSRVDAAGLDAYPLFLAYPTRDTCFAVPAPWAKAALWQYSWTGAVSGIPTPVDRDRFLGSKADLAAFSSFASPPSSAPSDAAVEPDPRDSSAHGDADGERDERDAAAAPGCY